MLLGAALHCAAAFADETARTWRIPAQDLGAALREFAHQSNREILFSSDAVKGKTTRGVDGTMSADAALTQLLAGTGLSARYANGMILVSRPEDAKPGSSPDPPGAAGGIPSEPPRGSSAQKSAPTAEPTSLEEVVVTAERHVQKLIDVPSSVTAIDANTLRQAGIDNMLDLSYAVPSLLVQDTGGGYQRYFIRGIANGNSTTSLVGVYLDEADITNNANTQLDIRAGDLDRVEVLKGPQGTLYGVGSAGGTIRLLTRDPDLSSFSASGDVKWYGTQYGTPSEEVSSVINIPLVSDTLGLRFAGTYGNLGGWIDQPATGLDNINNQDLRDGRLKALWTPTPEASVKATVEMHRNDGGGIDASSDANYNLTLAVNPTEPTRFDSGFDIYNLTATYDFTEVSLLSSTTYFDSVTSGIIGLIYPVAAPPAPLFQFLNNPDTRNTRSFSQEIRAASRGEGPFHWVVGAFYKNQQINYVTDYEFSSGGPVEGSGTSIDDEGSRSTSYFADGGYSFGRFEIGAGVRDFDDHRTEYDGVLFRTGSFHSVDPRFYMSYAITPDVHVYANMADGFRSGGFNGGYGLPESTFAPEKVREYELGAKMSLLGKSLNLDTAFFFSKYQDIQIFANTPNGIGELQNGGDAHIKGFDASLDWRPADALTLAVSGTVTTSELVSLLPGATIAIVGDPVDFTTDYTFRASGTYNFHINEGYPMFARLDFTTIGPSHLTDRSEGGPPILFKTDVINMLNARVGVSRGKWSADLFAENLLAANGIQDTAGAYGFGARPRPRTVGVEFRVATQ